MNKHCVEDSGLVGTSMPDSGEPVMVRNVLPLYVRDLTVEDRLILANLRRAGYDAWVGEASANDAQRILGKCPRCLCQGTSHYPWCKP